jgi:hypothetical protein
MRNDEGELARRKLEFEVAKLERELDKMALDMEKVRAEIRQENRRFLLQALTVGAALLAAGAAIGKLFL